MGKRSVSFSNSSKNFPLLWPGLSRRSTSFLLRCRQDVDARHGPAMTSHCTLCGDDFLALLAKALDAERDHVADIEESRRLHAGADPGRRAGGDDIARQQR